MKRGLMAVILAAALASPGLSRGADGLVEEVVVTATRTPVGTEESPQRVETIGARELEGAGGRLDEALDLVPAVSVNRAGSRFMAALPTIRGSQPGEVLVLLDGRRLNSQQSGWFNLSDLPVGAGWIERVEVLEGPSSALYGAEAMGGVVNIITRVPEEIPAASLRAWAGGPGDAGTEAMLSVPFGQARLAASAGRDSTRGDRDNGDGAQDRYSARLSWPGESAALTLSADGLGREMGSPGPAAFPTPGARQSDDTRLLGARMEWAAGALSLSADAFWNRYLRIYDDPGWGQHSRHLTHAAGIGAQGVWGAGPAGRWLAGVELSRDRLSSTNDGRRRLGRRAVFLQDEADLGRWGTLTLGGRWDGFSLFEDQFSPRAAVVVRPSEGLSLRASGARGYRTPTFDDLYWEDPFARGNPELEPERSWSWEAGARGRLPSGWSWSADVFRRDVRDLINWQDGDGDWVWEPVNISSARIEGGTASFAWATGREGRPARAAASYTWLRPLDMSGRSPIPGRPRHLLKGSLTLEGGPGRLDLGATWTDRYPAAGLERESYWSGDLRVSRPLAVPGLGRGELSLRVDNLFNQAHEVVPGYPMPGREATAELYWTF